MSYAVSLNLDASILKKFIKNSLFIVSFITNSLLTIATNSLREIGGVLISFIPNTYNCYGVVNYKYKK